MSKKTRDHGQKKQFNLADISPITDAQKKVFDEFSNGKHLFLDGCAGTGKTFISIFLALRELQDRRSEQQKIVIVRSALAVHDVGFLPGTLAEKIAMYELPYKAIVNELYQRGDAYELLKSKGMIEFVSTSYIRGTTINDAIVIVDETQNCTFHELDSVITRMGRGSRVIFCGDIDQTDFSKEKDKDSTEDFTDILDSMPSFATIEFHEEDIVRSGLVKEYLLAKNAFFDDAQNKMK